jgi:uncharacterized iron-regulated membrane protein
MILLFFAIFILLVGFILILMFIGGVITLFSDGQIAEKSEQPEITIVNQFENEMPERSNPQGFV